MEDTCKRLNCVFNDSGVCALSFELEIEEKWENYGTKKCEAEVAWVMEHQSVTE